MSLSDYRVRPPRGEERTCSRHGVPMEYVALRVRDMTDGEREKIARGWCCSQCWTARGFRLEVDE